MKFAIAAFAAVASMSLFADGWVTGVSSYYKGQKTPAQVSIGGKAAESLYNSLKVQENPITDEHSNLPYGAYKTGSDVSCSQEYGSYSCTIFVDETGHILH
jgi:hypothetical protein